MSCNNNICSSDLCTGCSACMNICAKRAITMQENECGFVFPVIDSALCVDCGLCEKICPALHPQSFNDTPKHTYATVCNDTEERSSSSSGGLSSLICRHIIRKGGVAYGCSQINYQDIRHIRVDNENDLYKLKGSKYVQSNIGYIFRDVKKDLQEGKYVAFSGTPCQIAGLKAFLQKDYEKLITLDLICHGVPSQKMLRDDIECYLKDGEESVFVNFRWKAKTGIQYGIQFGIQDDIKRSISKSISLPYDPYMFAFMTGYSIRENCHSCPYSQEKRIGDITIGDFWRLGAYAPTKLEIKYGVSLILVNSDKGQMLIEEIKSQLTTEERMLQEAIDGNSNLSFPSPRPINKDSFLMTYREYGLEAACKNAIPRTRYYKMVILEFVKRQELFVKIFKKIRSILLKK